MSGSRLPDALTWAEKRQTMLALGSITLQEYLEAGPLQKSHHGAKKAVPRPFAKERKRRRHEAAAREAERHRAKPYQVLCECNGATIVFGESDSPTGGMALNMARLVPWARNPRVVAR